MNSSNLQPRQFAHNTCELSIDDKKSPFPAWMKFNKPNPLRFSLQVQDPDRPELEPMTVTGDRSKLEELNLTVDEYVQKLLQRAPLPQLGGGENLEKSPQKSEAAEQATGLDNSIDRLAQNRPIDALNINDDKPHIEADGLSRHLFYLGSGAESNTAVMSLSTLQLFDLSSAMAEGLSPESEQSSALTTDPEVALTPVAISPPESMNNNNKGVVNPPKADVEQPRVVLPSVNELTVSESSDLYGLETESSILERSTPSREQFNKPKPSLGSLNLPELPDFSRSPLTSVPLWLGLGGMAALIVSFPFLSSYFKTGGSVAKKPAPIPTQIASAATDVPPEYQPTTPSLPNGVGTPTVGATNDSPLGGALSSVTAQPPGSPVSPVTGATVGGTGTNTDNDSLAARQRALLQQQQAAKNTAAQATAKTINSDAPRGARKPTADGISQQQQTRNQGNQSLSAPDLGEDPRLKPGSSGETSAKPRTRKINPAAIAARNSAGSDVDNAVVGQASEFTGGSGIFKPVETPAQSNPINLNDPSTAPVESVQTKGLQNYFQGRWKADPNFDESLQYRVNVSKSGRVLSVEGQTEKSRVYLSKTSFLKPGEMVSKSGQQDQKVWLILNPTGDIQTLADSE